MNEIIVLGGLILAGAAGYGVRAMLAKLDEIPADLEQVVIGFNCCDRCEFAGGHETAAAGLGDALLAAAGQRGISRGQLLGFIALASIPVGEAAAAASAPAPHWSWPRNGRHRPCGIPDFGLAGYWGGPSRAGPARRRPPDELPRWPWPRAGSWRSRRSRQPGSWRPPGRT